MAPQDIDHYAALDLEPSATEPEIRASWRFLLAAFHPDRFRDPGQRERAEEITKRVNAAWQTLGDPAARLRYDRRRAARAADPPPPEAREMPCPACATRSRVADAGGRMVTLACPACGEAFRAIVGARWAGRPRLERRWMSLTYRALLADDEGLTTPVTFRRLPSELALPEGERVSVVFGSRRDRPAYAIVHGGAIDVCWRVG